MLSIRRILLCGALAMSACYSREADVSEEALALAAQLVWPMSGTVSRTTAATNHGGIDIAAPAGTPVFAARSGDVVPGFNNPGGYGCNVVINHTGGGSVAVGVITIYAHLDFIAVAPGSHVEQGAFLGYSGGNRGAACAGNSTGAHLHFELRNNLVSIRGWDGSVHAGDHVAANTGIDTYIPELPPASDCDAACAQFGCACVDGTCSGGFCPGTGCSAAETQACAAFGANCVDHQCNGGYAPGTGCTAREMLDCGAFGANCVDHVCSGGYAPEGTGCTARETIDCGAFGASCVDHACNGGYAPGTGCTAGETAACAQFGVNCVDHQCSGGYGPGTGCTAKETTDCASVACNCVDHSCSGGFCPGTGCTAREELDCQQAGRACAEHQCI
jgi:hypothetical protein